jgi:hypothetical protein
MHWSPDSSGLIDELARTMAVAGVGRVTLVADRGEAKIQPRSDIEVRQLVIDPRLGADELVDRLVDEVAIVEAHSVIVLPRTNIDEPDSSSRLTCAAIRKACGDRVGPNVLVEIEDPEAAFEFVGLGVATVFYSGHLRAALLGQACVDLGVFQFILGLLRGRHRVRTIEVPAELREKSFAEAALELELDECGRPMTVIGVAWPKQASRGSAPEPPSRGTASELGGGVVVNPGPNTSLREVLGLLALVGGDEHEEAVS